MKSMRSACKVSAAKKLSNMRKGYKHGGKVYADGGMVDGEDEEMNEPMSTAHEGMGIEGKKAKSRLDKGGKTHINIIIAGGGKSPEPMPAVTPPMPPVPGKPPLPMIPPMGAGAGPMPPMKNGGRMAYKNGGKVKHAAGGGLGRLEKIKAYGLKPAKGK